MMRRTTAERWKILVVGNNPMEMNAVLDRLRAIRQKSVHAEMAFDATKVSERLIEFRPHHLLIDDNMGRQALTELLGGIPRRVRGIPITLLKNSNYQEVSIPGISNYVLKQHLSSYHLYCELLNAQLFHSSSLHWRKMYYRSKGPLQRLFRSGSPV